LRPFFIAFFHLFAIEKTLQDLSGEERKAQRLEQEKPVLEGFWSSVYISKIHLSGLTWRSVWAISRVSRRLSSLEPKNSRNLQRGQNLIILQVLLFFYPPSCLTLTKHAISRIISVCICTKTHTPRGIHSYVTD